MSIVQKMRRLHHNYSPSFMRYFNQVQHVIRLIIQWLLFSALTSHASCQLRDQSTLSHLRTSGDLSVIKSAIENQFLLSSVEDKGESWLGMEASNGDNDFAWIDGTSVAETFSGWAYGEPNYPGVDENCS